MCQQEIYLENDNMVQFDLKESLSHFKNFCPELTRNLRRKLRICLTLLQLTNFTETPEEIALFSNYHLLPKILVTSSNSKAILKTASL